MLSSEDDSLFLSQDRLKAVSIIISFKLTCISCITEREDWVGGDTPRGSEGCLLHATRLTSASKEVGQAREWHSGMHSSSKKTSILQSYFARQREGDIPVLFPLARLGIVVESFKRKFCPTSLAVSVYCFSFLSCSNLWACSKKQTNRGSNGKEDLRKVCK